MKEEKTKQYVIIFRVIQSFFVGLFALGVSLIIGDYTEYVQTPISSIAIVTTIFGLIGAVLTEFYARKAENW